MAHVDELCQFPVMLINHNSFLLKLKAAQEQDDEIRAIKEILLVKPYNDYCYIRVRRYSSLLELINLVTLQVALPAIIRDTVTVYIKYTY